VIGSELEPWLEQQLPLYNEVRSPTTGYDLSDSTYMAAVHERELEAELRRQQEDRAALWQREQREIELRQLSSVSKPLTFR